MPLLNRRRLAQSIARNTLFGIVAKLAQAGTRLVTIPIVIAHCGLGGYGVWSILMTAAAYMRFGSVGTKSAFQKYVAEATGTGDYRAASRLLSTGCALLLALSVAGLLPVAFHAGRLARAAGVPAEFLAPAARAISILAVIMLLSNVGAAFEAIVLGAHRIDLARRLTTGFTIAEAVAIVLLLHFGRGLVAMATVMALSELGFVAGCFLLARRILPAVEVRPGLVTAAVVPELVRFAGSYQLVNVLEILYVSILPVTILRAFGAEAAGVYAVATKFVSSVLMAPDALLVPVLSGGTMVFAAGSAEDMRKLVGKAFQVTLSLSLFPLGFLALFGGTLVLAWTGRADPAFPAVLRLTALNGLFYALSLLLLVLYRISGRASLDNLRQALRIVILLAVAPLAARLGFYGLLAGLAAAELAGMLFMLFALTKTFRGFEARHLWPDTLRLAGATLAVLAAGLAAAQVPLPPASPRMSALLHLAVTASACLAAAGPIIWGAKLLSAAEERTVLDWFLPARRLARAAGERP